MSVSHLHQPFDPSLDDAASETGLQPKLCPIHWLPEEILSEIFLDYVYTFAWSNQIFPRRQFSPLILTWICSRWRLSATSTPQLWVFHCVPRQEALHRKLVSFTKLALSYSKCCGLHIHISSLSATASHLLFAESDRWESAHISISNHDLEQELTYIPKHGNYPLLEHLTLDYDAPYPLPFFAFSPKLHTLRVVEMRWQLIDHPADSANTSKTNSDRSPLPWSQIRTITGSASLRVLHTLLNLCTHLEKIDVVQEQFPSFTLPHTGLPGNNGQPHQYNNQYSPLNIIGDDDISIDALHLHYLSVVTAIDQPPLTNWLRRAPELVALDLSINSNDKSSRKIHKQVVDDLTEFIRRSGCCLERFALSRVRISPGQLIKLFKLMPMLKKVRFGQHAPTHRSYLSVLRDNTVLSRLRITASAKPLLPRLDHFSLNIPVVHVSAELESLLDFLESRRLVSPWLSLDQPESFTDKPRFLVERLLKIEFTGSVAEMLQQGAYSERVRRLIEPLN